MMLKVWEVRITQTVFENATVLIEAPTQKEAERIAICCHEHPVYHQPDWRYAEALDTEVFDSEESLGKWETPIPWELGKQLLEEKTQ